MKLKFNSIAINSLLYTLYMFGACFITMLVESLFVFIIDKIIAIPFPVLTILRVMIYSVGVCAILSCIGYFEGYREGDAAIGDTIIGGGIAILFHFILSMLFHFQAFVSGGVRFAAGLIGHGMGVTSDALNKDTSILLFIAMFIIYGLAYVGILTIARYFGAQKRIVDRADLRRDEADDIH